MVRLTKTPGEIKNIFKQELKEFKISQETYNSIKEILDDYKPDMTESESKEYFERMKQADSMIDNDIINAKKQKNRQLNPYDNRFENY